MPEDVHDREPEPLTEDVLPDEVEAPEVVEEMPAGEAVKKADGNEVRADEAETSPEGEEPAVEPETPEDQGAEQAEIQEEPPSEETTEDSPPTAEEDAAEEDAAEEDATEDSVEEEAPEEGAPEQAAAEEEEAVPSNKSWYVVKVQSGREESIKEAIERRVRIEGLEEYFGQIHIPTERVTEVRNSKRVEKERKLYPGYIMAEVEYNDRILYLFRETSGVGDFVGGTTTRPPPPMSPREVERMMGKPGEPTSKVVGTKPKVDVGERVRITEGAFKDMEGEVKQILEAVSKVSVEVSIFGRPVPVELEYWQVEQV